MKTKRQICLALVLVTVCALLSGCASAGKVKETSTNTGESAALFRELQADGGETVTIPTEGITRTASFFNYDADGVTIQLVALRDQDGGVHIAFNTCQSCSPSPKAYYQQSGELLKCTNCGFTFAPEEVGVTHGGCNPWPIDGVLIGEDEITVPVAALKAMRPTFASWAGPTEQR